MKLIRILLLIAVLGGCSGVRERGDVRTVEIDSQGLRCADCAATYNSVNPLIVAMSKLGITKIQVHSAMKLTPERENELLRAFVPDSRSSPFGYQPAKPPVIAT